MTELAAILGGVLLAILGALAAAWRGYTKGKQDAASEQDSAALDEARKVKGVRQDVDRKGRDDVRDTFHRWMRDDDE